MRWILTVNEFECYNVPEKKQKKNVRFGVRFGSFNDVLFFVFTDPKAYEVMKFFGFLIC